jgi:hypothetical protein
MGQTGPVTGKLYNYILDVLGLNHVWSPAMVFKQGTVAFAHFLKAIKL